MDNCKNINLSNTQETFNSTNHSDGSWQNSSSDLSSSNTEEPFTWQGLMYEPEHQLPGPSQDVKDFTLGTFLPPCKISLPSFAVSGDGQVPAPPPKEPEIKKKKKRKTKTKKKKEPETKIEGLENHQNPHPSTLNETHGDALQKLQELRSREEGTTLPSFRPMKFKKRVGICHEDFPHVLLDTYQLEALATEVLNDILTRGGRRVKPRFSGAGISEGCLVLICGNEATVSWVRSLPKTLRRVTGIRLKSVEEPEDGSRVDVIGFFPNSGNDSNSRILQFLSNQNEGVDCSRWRVLNRELDVQSSVWLTLSVDFVSAEKMKALGPNLNYKFGCAKFMLRGEKGVDFEEAVEMGDFMKWWPDPFIHLHSGCWGQGFGDASPAPPFFSSNIGYQAQRDWVVQTAAGSQNLPPSEFGPEIYFSKNENDLKELIKQKKRERKKKSKYKKKKKKVKEVAG